MKQLLISTLVMLGLPWLAVTFAPGDAGMAACFLLFFAVNPVYSVVAGVFSGRTAKRLWFQPIVTSLLFLVGSWLLFDPGETAFLLYAALYLLLGLAAMGITAFIVARK